MIHSDSAPTPETSAVLPIAFVTMARDEEIYLHAWIQQGIRISRQAVFYIYDHASNPALSISVGSHYAESGIDLNFIALPAMPFDDDFKAMALSNLAKTLLSAYQVVVVSDADELIIGYNIANDEILPILLSAEPFVAPIGFEFVQHKTKERPFDPFQPIGGQRRYGFFSAAYSKPIIWRACSEFGAGLHRLHHDFSYCPSLLLAHLRSIDITTNIQRAEQRKRIHFSNSHLAAQRQSNWLAGHSTDFHEELLKIENVPHQDEIFSKFILSLQAAHCQTNGFYGHGIKLTTEYCDISSALHGASHYTRPPKNGK